MASPHLRTFEREYIRVNKGTYEVKWLDGGTVPPFNEPLYYMYLGFIDFNVCRLFLLAFLYFFHLFFFFITVIGWRSWGVVGGGGRVTWTCWGVVRRGRGVGWRCWTVLWRGGGILR